MRGVSLLGLVVVTHIGCGKPEPVAGEPRRASLADAAAEPTPSTPGTPASDADANTVPRVALTAEFHRTRVAAQAGYWVLGMIHNQHTRAITDVRAEVRFFDAADELVGRAEARLAGRYAGDADIPVAVHVAAPVEHERLELSASAIDSAEDPPVLTLELEHDPPARADLGGWFVLGQVSNVGEQTVEGARLEILGLDRDGRLLGIDWLALEPLASGDVRPFDLGELRYEQVPDSFALELRSGL